MYLKYYFKYLLSILMGILNTIIPKYFKMYFKYNWSCICILHFCKSETLSQNTVQVIVKLSFMLRKKCYQIEFFYSSYKCNTRYIWVFSHYHTTTRPVSPRGTTFFEGCPNNYGTPRRNRLGDEHFQKLLLLNANKQ